MLGEAMLPGLSSGLIRSRVAEFASGQGEEAVQVAALSDLGRTPIRRLGKRVGGSTLRSSKLPILRHPDQETTPWSVGQAQPVICVRMPVFGVWLHLILDGSASVDP